MNIWENCSNFIDRNKKDFFLILVPTYLIFSLCSCKHSLKKKKYFGLLLSSLTSNWKRERRQIILNKMSCKLITGNMIKPWSN